MGYRTFFGLQKEPFAQDIRVEDLYPLPGLRAAMERFMYAAETRGHLPDHRGCGQRQIHCPAVMPPANCHPSQYKVVSLVGSTVSIIDLLRQQRPYRL